MKVSYRNSIQYKVERRIMCMRTKVILRSDLNDLAAYRQISRALARLVKQQKLIKIGKGVYVKTRFSLIDGQPTIDGAFTEIAREALTKLGVRWEAEKAEQQYQAGISTQVPANGRICLRSRFNRRLAWGGMELSYAKFKSSR